MIKCPQKCGISNGYDPFEIKHITEEKQMGEKLTRSDVKKIEEEIEYRKLVVRKDAIEAVKEARAQGDLSENFEYYAAKKEKNQNESRIRYLEKMLKTATLIDDSSDEDKMGINNTAEVFFEDDNETDTFRLVTSIRGDILNNLISTESPLGKALLGHKEGDRIFVDTGNGNGYHIILKKIIKTNDDSADRIRRF